MNLNIMVVV